MEPHTPPDEPPWWPVPDEPRSHGSTRVQSIACGNCGWPSACLTQEGLRILRFVCHWCGKVTVGVVDPDIKRNIIF